MSEAKEKQADQPAKPQGQTEPPKKPTSIGPIQIGLLTGQHLDGEQIGRDLRDLCHRVFPQFDWRVSVVEVVAFDSANFNPMQLCEWLYQFGSQEGLDIVLGMSPQGLQTHTPELAYGLHASSALDVAAISFSNLSGRSLSAESGGKGMIPFANLCFLAIAHICGLNISNQERDELQSMLKKDLDAFATAVFRNVSSQKEQIKPILVEMADPRIEEGSAAPRSRTVMVLKTILQNRRDLLNHLKFRQMLHLPMRIPKFSMAALSAFVLILITEETWAIGSALSLPYALLLAAGSILLPFAVLLKNRTISVRGGGNLTEQQTLAMVVATINLFASFALAFIYLLLVSGFTVFVLIPDTIRVDWLGVATPVGGPQLNYIIFSSAVALIVGAFGATLESKSDFQKNLLIDFEI